MVQRAHSGLGRLSRTKVKKTLSSVLLLILHKESLSGQNVILQREAPAHQKGLYQAFSSHDTDENKHLSNKADREPD